MWYVPVPLSPSYKSQLNADASSSAQLEPPAQPGIASTAVPPPARAVIYPAPAPNATTAATSKSASPHSPAHPPCSTWTSVTPATTSPCALAARTAQMVPFARSSSAARKENVCPLLRHARVNSASSKRLIRAERALRPESIGVEWTR